MMSDNEVRLEQAESLVELPARLETAVFFSPVTFSLTQSTFALNAANFGGSQEISTGNMSSTTIEVG